jgi:hypothetical protein
MGEADRGGHGDIFSHMISAWWVAPLVVGAAGALALERLRRAVRAETERLRRAAVEVRRAAVDARTRQ